MVNMSIMTKRNFLFIPLFSFIVIAGCTKDRTPAGIDAELFSKAQRKEGFAYYNFSTEFLASTKVGGHKSTYFRTKYNSLAATILDSTGIAFPGSFFPEGSMIVNEMSSIKGEPEKYAIMFKDKNSDYADEKGWVWSYANADNTIIEPASRKGISCISCHSSDNSTLMSTFSSGEKK